MMHSHRSTLWMLMLFSLATALFSCSSGVHSRSVLGGKRNKNKNFFDRYIPVHFHAKRQTKIKTQLKADEQEGDTEKLAETQPLPEPPVMLTTEPAVIETPAAAEEPATPVLLEVSETNPPLHEESSSVEAQPSNDVAVRNLTTGIQQQLTFTGLPALAAAPGKHLTQQTRIWAGKKIYSGNFKSVFKKLHVQAAKKGKSFLWVLYFAIAQGFTALFLGFKQIFNMLDTPIDSGNKALGVSYAAIAILAIHAILLIGLVKNFI